MTEPQHSHAPAASRGEPSWLQDPAEAPAGATAQPDEMLTLLRNLVETHHAALKAEDALARLDARHHHAGRTEALKLAAEIGSTSDMVDLELLVRDALQSFQFGFASGIHIQGPTVLLRAAPAKMLALALHELTTNAIKFGALNSASRRQAITIGWRHGAYGVDFRWRETGVAIVGSACATRVGFGRSLIETLFPRYCATSTRFDLLPGGVACTIALPEASLFY